ncbi:MAG: histidinol dehydrogenase [Acidobacteriota bacterium]|nr:histidinol dehydrogenase [Acidobacteriota bacterium]
MKTIRYPKKKDWQEITKRPTIDTKFLEKTVSNILEDVKAHGDAALRHCARHFDKVELDDFLVSEAEFIEAEEQISTELKNAIQTAKANIEKFHTAQIEQPEIIETTGGVFCWRKSVAIEKVGLYIPAGTAPLFSTVLMLAIPAKLAGCREIIVCSPPDSNGKINAATLYSARLCGATKVFKIGGAQAVGALAFGTETVPKVYKIFGPGNQFVTEAKQQISKTGTAIDMPAGPSEVAVLADETCIPAFVAADLLSQAEHGVDSQVLLVTTSEKVVEETLIELEKQLEVLPRKNIAEKALGNSTAVLVENMDEAVALLNEYAAEHLIIATETADETAEKIINAGSIFIGNYSCEAAGDYASGTNHTLPTNGYAKAFSGVSLDSFVKKITFQKLSADGIINLGRTIECLAEAEGLDAHKNAVSIRLEKLAANYTNSANKKLHK